MMMAQTKTAEAAAEETAAAMQAQLVAQLELHVPPPASPWPEHQCHACSLSASMDSAMRSDATPGGAEQMRTFT